MYNETSKSSDKQDVSYYLDRFQTEKAVIQAYDFHEGYNGLYNSYSGITGYDTEFGMQMGFSMSMLGSYPEQLLNNMDTIHEALIYNKAIQKEEKVLNILLTKYFEGDRLTPRCIDGLKNKLRSNSWYDNVISAELNKREIKNMRTVASLWLDFVPLLGNGKTAFETYKGYDYVGGERIGTFGRVAGGVGIAIPLLKKARYLKNIGKYGDELLEGASEIVERGSRFGGDTKVVKAYWNDYYSVAGQQGDDIENLITSAQKRTYRKGNLMVEDLGYAGYNNGRIAVSSNTKRWEFIEEFLHYKVDNNQAFRTVRKGFQKELKARRIKNIGRVSEEMAVKQWMLNKSRLLKLDDATQTLLKNQIEQLGRYGLEYGY